MDGILIEPLIPLTFSALPVVADVQISIIVRVYFVQAPTSLHPMLSPAPSH